MINNDISTKIRLSGLNCFACIKLIEKRIKEINGVKKVNIELKDGSTEILGSKIIKNEEIVSALSDTDFNIL